MAKYIHLITATKTPKNRSTNSTPFEDFEVNPNIDGPFGLDETEMFALVNETPAPTLDNVIQKATANTTLSDQGAIIQGVYVPDGGDGTWDYTYTVEDQDIDVSRFNKQQLLQADFNAAKAAGFVYTQVAVDYTFELSEEGFDKATRKRSNNVFNPPAGDTKVEDLTGALVTMNAGQFNVFQSACSTAWENVEEQYGQAVSDIKLASTPALVGAVAWDFTPA